MTAELCPKCGAYWKCDCIVVHLWDAITQTWVPEKMLVKDGPPTITITIGGTDVRDSHSMPPLIVEGWTN